MESYMPKLSLCRYLDPALQEIPDSNLLAPHQQEIWILFHIFRNGHLTIPELLLQYFLHHYQYELCFWHVMDRTIVDISIYRGKSIIKGIPF